MPRSRPRSITAVGWLLYAAAALLLGNVVITAVTYSSVTGYIRRAYSEMPYEQSVMSDAVLMLGLLSGFEILFALVAMSAAISTLSGSRSMRTVTFVVAGLAVLCTGGSATNAVSNAPFVTSGGGLPEPVVRLNELLPAWARTSTRIIDVLVVLTFVAVVVLLTLPGPNAYLRRNTPRFRPGLVQEPMDPSRDS
ncbi:MAG TPA: hypothetical protein VGJ28_10445 [Micromonosporaceae bacterium]|jgi:hypothetical protein